MNARLLAAGAVAILAVGCGGSSKKQNTHVAAHDVAYTGPSATVSVTTAAGAQSAASSAIANLDAVNGNMGSFMTMGVSGPVPAVTVQEAARIAAGAAAKLAAGAATVSGTTVTDTAPCDVSGSMSGTLTASDINNPFRHTGDSAAITFSSCVNTPGTIMDGTVRISVSAADGQDCLKGSVTALTQNFVYAVTLTFTDVSFQTDQGAWFGMDGNVTTTVKKLTSSIERSITGTGLVYAVGQGSQLLAGTLLTAPSGHTQYDQTVVENYTGGFTTLASTDASQNMKVCSTDLNGCVQVVTNTAVHDVSGDPNPSSGSVTISAGKVSIRLDILSNANVDVTYDLDTTASPPDPVTVHATWTCLRADTCTF